MNASDLSKLFKKVESPIVVFFWKPFFGPCEMFMPIFSDASLKLADKVVFCSLNIEKYAEARDKFMITDVPIVIAFKKNAEIGRQSGSMFSDSFMNWLGATLGL